jgi:hypothetical protein
MEARLYDLVTSGTDFVLTVQRLLPVFCSAQALGLVLSLGASVFRWRARGSREPCGTAWGY